ncbi:hypothetical protein ACM0CO_19455 [Mycobacteroides abscessus subsp. abscessus]|uniref:hypothetical protein n=1 Tax=Mycobacteroides abscessus TaxID=36809 RepID=UPI0039F0776E
MHEPRKLRVISGTGGGVRPPLALRWAAAAVGTAMMALTAHTVWPLLTQTRWGTPESMTELAYLVIFCAVGCGGMLFAWSIYRRGFDGPTDLLGQALMRTVPGLVLSGLTASALTLSMARLAYISEVPWPYVISTFLWAVAAFRWLRRSHHLWLAQRVAASSGPALEAIP